MNAHGPGAEVLADHTTSHIVTGDLFDIQAGADTDKTNIYL